MDIDNNNKVHAVPVKKTGHKLTTGAFLGMVLASLIIYFLFKFNVIVLGIKYRHLALNISLAFVISFLVLAGSSFSRHIVMQRSRQKYLRYNLLQVIRLVSILLVIVIFISFLFQNWYTAAVSLGLISLIFGFALQTPISSFIGWLYVIFRSPYHVGDRIQVGTFKGDVVEIGYLDTTLWEFGGDYLTNDVPSGRLIRFPNSLVLQSAIFNYSWEKFPYIWNEIPFHVAYESDLDFVEATLTSVAKKELGEEMVKHVAELKELVKFTPVDELEIKEFPFISFRTNQNTWVEATLTYLVPPKQASDIRTRILRKAITELLKQPEKVMFPKTNSR